jgi:hypothetical protein
MSVLDTSQAQTSNYSSTNPDLDIDTKSVDSPQGEETRWINKDWPTYWGMFNEHADLKSALIIKSLFCCGNGYTCDPTTQVLLRNIKGWGKDSFEDVLFNMDLISNLAGDSYAEIIRDESKPAPFNLLNLKPLDPGSMEIIVDESGVITGYNQIKEYPKKGIINRIKNVFGAKKRIEFKPHEIFHLSKLRLCDQCHGISLVAGLTKTINADNERFEDQRKMMHHQSVPFLMWKLKTDKKSKIDAFIARVSEARKNKDDLFVPDDENIATMERVEIDIPAAIFQYEDSLRNKFYRSILTPQVLAGSGGGGTQTDNKVIYLGHEQIVSRDEVYLEKQILNQLQLKISIIPPSSLAAPMQANEQKLGQGQGLLPQQNELNPGATE